MLILLKKSRRKVCLEEIPRLPTDHDDYYEMQTVSLTNVTKLLKLLAPIFYRQQCKGNAKDDVSDLFCLFFWMAYVNLQLEIEDPEA